MKKKYCKIESKIFKISCSLQYIISISAHCVTTGLARKFFLKKGSACYLYVCKNGNESALSTISFDYYYVKICTSIIKIFPCEKN